MRIKINSKNVGSRLMSQTNTTAASPQTARHSSWAQPHARSLFSIVLVLILLSRAAFAAQFGGLNVPALAERERSAPATFPDKARFTLSPDVRLTHSALLERASLLAQNVSAPSPAAASFDPATSMPPWGVQKSYLIPALEIVGFDVLLNLFDRAYYGCCDFDTDLSSIKRN